MNSGGAEQTLAFSSGHYLQVILALAAIVGLIYAMAWLVRRLNGAGFSGSASMRVLGGMAVGNRERVVLVEVGGQQMLLGVAPGRVNTLHVFDEPVIEPDSTRSKSDFAARLRGVMAQRGDAR